ncbi:MAG: Fe2+-dependent dioxygenase [Betaproteobacteria bacterium]|nr:Fe2+-dependent dioxygenase [Betaproteobacteria bacterium]
MLLHVPEVLSAGAVAHVRSLIDAAPWSDGRITAGTQSAKVKNNEQLPQESEAAKAARAIVLAALDRSALFITGALPKAIYPPLFNRYTGAANSFGNHVDNAIRTNPVTRENVRTDVSVTLFLSEPDDYDGGELVIEDTFGLQTVKLPAGDLILYPSSSVHRVEPVTRGARVASFFWVQSFIRSPEQRRLLFDIDMSVMELRAADGETDAVVRLTSCYHNLMRMWAEN